MGGEWIQEWGVFIWKAQEGGFSMSMEQISSVLGNIPDANVQNQHVESHTTRKIERNSITS
jgi:hypothetical protein